MNAVSPIVCCLLCAAVMASSGLLSFLFARTRSVYLWLGCLGGVVGCILGAVAVFAARLSPGRSDLRVQWNLPVGSFHIGIDAISSFFLLVLCVVCASTTFYTLGHIGAQRGARGAAHQLGWSNLVMAAMVMVLLARDALLFIMAWEVMSVASFFLVTCDHERDDVRRGGYVYLVASHIGTVFIFLHFAWMYRHFGSLDLDQWAAAQSGRAVPSAPAFLFALIGFGTKAGVFPLHFWMPQTYCAAPSPAAAMMSGVLKKLGIYGIIRAVLCMGQEPSWWGVTLVGLGAVTGIVGVLLALSARDLKRTLAYSSAENIGIILLGLGLGIMGKSDHNPVLAFLGFGGALFHVLNHALFKGLLFEIAGQVLLQTGQLNMNLLGGLLKRMPVTGALFLIASLAACGLPPFNGFIGEWLLYVGALDGAHSSDPHVAIVAVLALAALALIGSLALACFARAFGATFLGNPRTPAVDRAQEGGALLLVPMAALAALCAALGVFPLWGLRLASPAIAQLAGPAPVPATASSMLRSFSHLAVALLALAAVLLLARWFMLRRRSVNRAATWGCGYIAPTPRIQTSASSFSYPLLTNFNAVVAQRANRFPTSSVFAAEHQQTLEYQDIAAERWIFPFVQALSNFLTRLQVLQQGRIQLYLLYLFGALVILLGWQLLVS